jgi:hypothetical protein
MSPRTPDIRLCREHPRGREALGMAITEAVSAYETTGSTEPAAVVGTAAGNAATGRAVTGGPASVAPAGRTAVAGTGVAGTGVAERTLTGKGVAGRTAAGKAATRECATGGGSAADGGGSAGFTPVPVWFFAFEGLIGASYDIAKSSPHAWIVIAVAVVTNGLLARTVLRGRLKMAKAILRGKKTRKIAVGLVALRVGVHFGLGLIGVEATTQAAHVAFAALMCATTVALLAFDQRVMLRALNNC